MIEFFSSESKKGRVKKGIDPNWIIIPIILLFSLLFLPLLKMGQATAQGDTYPAPSDEEGLKPIHPLIPLLDLNRQPVIDTGLPISTRATCGQCHDYDLISRGFHSQQGRQEILRKNNQTGEFPNLVSQGMYGKWCCLPNRQLTPLYVTRKEDFDFGTADWLRSCGTCHVGGGIGEFDRLERRYDRVSRDSISDLDPDYHIYSEKYDRLTTWDWKESGLAEVDCFLCHFPNFNRAARDSQIKEGYFAWALTATLLGSGIVEEEAGELKYNPLAFWPDKTVRSELLQLREPGVDNCGQCHGFAGVGEKANHIDPFLSQELLRGTKKRGRIWSSAKIRDSQVKFSIDSEAQRYKGTKAEKKDALDFAWDAHAAKNLKCIDCHFSPNNPAKSIRDKRKANHLIYQPPTKAWRDFLMRPDHNLAKGDVYPETVSDNLDHTMRGCSDCHQASEIHQWLPYQSFHFRTLACETCHIPYKYYWACQQIDLTTSPKGISKYRGIIGDYRDPHALVTGFQPAYFLKKTRDGLSAKIIPCNPITSLFWFDQEKGRPAFPHQVRRAFYQWNENYQLKMLPEVVSFFDRDLDNKVDEQEIRLNSSQKIEFAKALIRKQGIRKPNLKLEILPFSLNHNIAGRKQAIKDCRECHSPTSRLGKEVEIFDYLPHGIEAEVASIVPRRLKGSSTARLREGKLFYNPDSELKNFYIMGMSESGVVDQLGWIAVLISLAGAVVHGSLIILLHKRKLKLFSLQKED